MADDVKASAEEEEPTIEEVPVEELDKVAGGFARAEGVNPEFERAK